MDRRRFFRAAAAGGCLLATGAAGRPQRVTREFAALGTKMSLVVLHGDAQRAHRACEAAIGEIRRVERSLSLYRPESDLSRLNRQGFVDAPDPYLVDALRAAQSISRLSHGAFDVTVQPLWELYARAKREGRSASAAEIAAARRLVDWRRIEVQPDRVRFTAPHMAATLNGIAQGFAADRAADALRREGIEHALVDAGEIAPLGRSEDGRPWTAGIQHPRQEDAFVAVVRLEGRCLATSGDYATRFGRDFRLNHLFDPHSGASPGHYASVSVVAPSATVADGLSTALSMLVPDKALERIRAVPGADALLVLKSERLLSTPGFPA